MLLVAHIDTFAMESKKLIKTLKNILRKQRVTYFDVANALHLSEASVKRMFSKQDMSVSRIDKILKLVSLDFSDLVTVAESETVMISCLSEEQEKELVSDTTLLLVAIAIRNRLSIDEIVDTYAISREKCLLQLRRIEKQGLIELRPDERIKLLMSPQFAWIKDGYIERFFRENTLSELFNSRFDGPGETFVVAHGMLSRKSNQRIQELSQRLISEYYALYEEDSKLPMAERFGTTMVFAMRPLELSLFKNLRRDGKTKNF